jgi:hypothetical protein
MFTERAEALVSIVTGPVLESKITSSEAEGTVAPGVPPEDRDHVLVDDQFPESAYRTLVAAAVVNV